MVEGGKAMRRIRGIVRKNHVVIAVLINVDKSQARVASLGVDDPRPLGQRKG